MICFKVLFWTVCSSKGISRFWSHIISYHSSKQNTGSKQRPSLLTLDSRWYPRLTRNLNSQFPLYRYQEKNKKIFYSAFYFRFMWIVGLRVALVYFFLTASTFMFLLGLLSYLLYLYWACRITSLFSSSLLKWTSCRTFATVLLKNV